MRSGFTLFFGVLDVIKFSHGDVLTVGAFTAFATYLALKAMQVASPWIQLIAISLVAMMAMALLGALIAKYLVLPLRTAPALNTLLITLMLGTVLREGVRLIFPTGPTRSRSRACCRATPTRSARSRCASTA